MRHPLPRIRAAALLAMLAAAGACERRSAPPPPPPPPAPPPAPPPVAFSTDPICGDAPRVAPAVRAPGDHVLLLVQRELSPDLVHLVGVAVVTPGGELRPARAAPGERVDPYARWGLRPGGGVTLLRAGRPVGTAVVDSVLIYGADATIRTADASGGARLATDLAPVRGPPLLRPPTRAQRSAMRALLRDTMAAHGYGWEDGQELRVAAVAIPGGGLALVGSTLQLTVTRAVDFPNMSVFIIAEREADGGWRVMYAHLWADDYDPYTPHLVDVADVDGDGVPELVTDTHATAGSSMFSVFRRGAGRWTEVLRVPC